MRQHDESHEQELSAPQQVVQTLLAGMTCSEGREAVMRFLKRAHEDDVWPLIDLLAAIAPTGMLEAIAIRTVGRDDSHRQKGR